MQFVWFWTFWHWSKEGFQDGFLLRSPIQGIGGHWDEWFRHEASASDLRAIEETGRTESSQRQFIAWFFRHWARETNWRENRMVPRFVLGQLAHLPPFNRWTAFDKYREQYGARGISAVVLSAESKGEADDVRRLEALALPSDSNSSIVPEGFQADSAELEVSRQAAFSVFRGKGLLYFLALWTAGGDRPYARWLKILVGLGWATVAGLILYLLFGPDAGEHLVALSATLVSLWSALTLFAVGMICTQVIRAWQAGKLCGERLQRSEVRLRMDGGLTLKGESAGLAFSLNTLLSLYRADSQLAQRSWLWRRLFRRLCTQAGSWAATGVITADGRLKSVVLQPKLRACLQRPDIDHILTPNQRDATRKSVDLMVKAVSPIAPAPIKSSALRAGWGFAAEEPRLQSHRCRHVAQALMVFGGFHSKWQKAISALAVLVSCAMLLALPDLRSILVPPPAPVAVAPSSTSPYYLWVSLDTKAPARFQVVLESEFWSNRRVRVLPQRAANVPARAEILLHRLPTPTGREDDATIWVERRLQFLTREYAAGERVGCYSLAYLTRLGHE
ncbi:MAG TPA: hypothetical protein VH597_17880 [Verrucomicrobiae bacterium]|jgi:hypothetical protein|nr:hypothetical protein [Verrucomicrobiae bacterium]